MSWKSENDKDAAPATLRFLPAREPGVQLSAADNHTPLDLFKLFFSDSAVETLCKNTNKQAARSIARGVEYKWTDVGVAEFYRYIGLIFLMGMVKLTDVRDYWRKCYYHTVPVAAEAMARDRFRTISWNVHMSDPDEDRVNDAKRGTSAHDRLFRLKPLMDTIRNACKAFYQPRRNIAVDERMVASPKCGFKLFVLADSSNGYTLDISVYNGNNNFLTGQGLSYDSVMSLIDKRYLGSGYHVYMDDFYTSPKLFRDLFAAKFGACGAYKDVRRGCPRSAVNALNKMSPTGTYRWIRDGPLVYVKWMDTREVRAVCSTIHAAYTGDKRETRVKSRKGVWSSQSLPCPSPVVEYNKFIGGLYSSDQYYTSQHKTSKWYKKLFYHFLDVAATNAYLLHKELTMQDMMHKDSMSHKAFMEELTAQLMGIPQKTQPQTSPVLNGRNLCSPVCEGEPPADGGKRARDNRKSCAHCRVQKGKDIKTPWKCRACDVYLCLLTDRNCFDAWHQGGN